MPAIPIACPKCGKRYAVDEQALGKMVTCQACKESFLAAREEEDFGLTPLDEAPRTAPPKPAAKPVPAQAAPVKSKPGVGVQVVVPGRQDLSDLLDDKVLGDFKAKPKKKGHGDDDDEGEEGDDLDEKPRRSKKPAFNPAQPRPKDDYSSEGLKNGILALGMVAILGGAVWAFMSGAVSMPNVSSGPPSYTLSEPKTYREGGYVMAAVNYQSKGGSPKTGERLYWVLEGAGELLESEITKEISSWGGTLKGQAFKLGSGPITNILSMRLELESGGKRTVVSNGVTSR